MKKSGFTLIELLVVVLIIGILAAIAVPQYAKVVLRSRFTQMVTFVNNVANSCDRYYELNGAMPPNWNAIDIEIPKAYIGDRTIESFIMTADSKYRLDMFDGSEKNITGYYGNPPIIGYAAWLRGASRQGKECWANPSDPNARSVCTSLGGARNGNAGGSFVSAWERYDLK